MEQKIEFINGIKVTTITSDEFDLASSELRQQRMNVCDGCEFKVNDSCSQCSCLLNVRIAYLESFCPEGKW
jgi:hypothetical protein